MKLSRSLATVAFLAIAISAFASRSPRRGTCADGSSLSPGSPITACTAVINSGGASDENRAVAFNNRGSAYFAMEQFDRAIADYDQAIRLKPDYADAPRGRGKAFQARGRFDLATAEFARALRVESAAAKP